MINRKVVGIIISSVGVIMFIASLGLFSVYSAIPIMTIKRFVFNLLSTFFDLTSIPAITILISGVIMAIFSLFSILLGLTSIPAITILISGVIMAIFSLFSILLGLDFFQSPFRSQLYVDHFANISFALLLILISGLVYTVSIFFLFKLKNLARKLIISGSIILILYFLPVSVYLFSDPWGWGGVAAISLLPYIIFPLFFIIFFIRPQIKEYFKK